MEVQQPSVQKSPKRKREEYEHGSHSAAPSFLHTTPQNHTGTDQVNVEWNRPHAAVTGQFEGLDIGAQTPSTLSEVAGKDRTRCEGKDHNCGEQAEQPEQHSERDSKDDDPAFTNEPELKVASPEDQCSAPSTPSKSTTKGKFKANQSSPHEPKKRRKSPPLTSEPDENPFTWHESEITGHDPTDPNDDGYGINGIGFKPTAAVAWDRSQRRKKQVEEWKKRESREARNRRRDKRDGLMSEDDISISPSSKKRVSFVK